MKFEFMTANRIIVETGGIIKLGEFTKPFGNHVLLVCRSNSSSTDTALRMLEQAGLKVTPAFVKGEPTIDALNQTLTIAKKNNVNVVVSVGGGSVLDTGKMIAALMTNEGDIMDYVEVIGKGVPLTKPSLPFIAVPTTSGTGAEVTKNGVVSSVEHRLKVSLRSPYMLADVVLIDPQLTISVPKDITASTGLDALTQVIEPYVSNHANPITDAFAIEGLKRIARSLKTAYDFPDDIQAREDMAIGSLFGGLALANAKLGAVHGFAGVLGGMYTIPHGVLCARLLPYVVKANIHALKAREPQHPALLKFDEIAKIVTDKPSSTALDSVRWLEELCTYFEIPTLNTFDINKAHFNDIVDKSKNSSSMKGNPIALTDDELKDILKQAL
jgi:alcohol dehydrogenase class IV